MGNRRKEERHAPLGLLSVFMAYPKIMISNSSEEVQDESGPVCHAEQKPHQHWQSFRRRASEYSWENFW